MIWKKFEVELYQSTVYVCLEPDGEKVIKRIKRAGFKIREVDRQAIVSDASGAACHLSGKEPGVFLLTVRKAEKESPTDLSIIVHECDHITNFIFDHIGQGAGVPSDHDEFHAYLLAYIFKKSLTIMWSK